MLVIKLLLLVTLLSLSFNTKEFAESSVGYGKDGSITSSTSPSKAGLLYKLIPLMKLVIVKYIVEKSDTVAFL